jgi:erythromycin esterase-like protein
VKEMKKTKASWNSRVMHMFVTLQTLLDLYVENAKAILWADASDPFLFIRISQEAIVH